jgi:hypothetical protein
MFEQLNRTLSLHENDTCFKYSEDKEALKKLMAEISVSVKVIGKDFYFDGDKEERIILRVIILRGEKNISFRFGMSIIDTELFSGNEPDRMQHNSFKRYTSVELMGKRKEVKDGLLYSVLSCIASDYFVPDTFTDFCSEFGYDEDSRKAEKLFHDCREQSTKLHTIFKEEEISCLPR